jgi:hypothetical protein
MDCQPVVEGKTRVAAVVVGGCWVLVQLRDKRSERGGEVLQEPEHVFSREQVLHHREAHEVQAEVARDRGRFNGCASQFVWVARPGWVGSRTRA